MTHSSARSMQVPFPVRHHSASLLTLGLALGLGGMLAGVSTPTVAAEIAQQGQTIQQVGERIVSDGIYLYGQSPDPEQIGSAYMIFESQNDRVVGAFYMPHSSFDCFYGSAESNQLALTVIDSYEETAHPFSVALHQSSDVASSIGGAIAPVSLEGFHLIEAISDNDMRILDVCQTMHGDHV
jgi:hypothetical protein